jgi:hypothetical protein
MAQAVTMFDGWFAGQRLSTTQRYLQVTANAIVKLNFQHSVLQPHFFVCIVSAVQFLFFFFNVQLHRYTTRTQRKKKQTNG